MSRNKTSNIRRARLWVAILALAAVAVVPALALAHGSYGAAAKRPAFDSGSLRLVGVGGYATQRKHSAIRVTVCLSKRYGGRFFDVRCQTDGDSDRRVKALVSVPGCVKGVWRTSAVGQALGRSGEWTHTASDVSASFRCP
jgi:hypothetical protein